MGGFGFATCFSTCTLEYADDANFIDEDVETASRRISSMEHGYKEDAAMEISKPKTKVMHVMKQEISPVRESDIAAAADRALLPYKCDYCPEVFPTIESLNGHMRCCGPGLRGVYDGEYEVESILDVRKCV